jgi:hypothetical protein
MSFKGGIVHSVLQLAARETSEPTVLEESGDGPGWHRRGMSYI